jgi:MarR family transcriptional regulator, lower aerobic nicotinate degradation pathway regulator
MGEIDSAYSFMKELAELAQKYHAQHGTTPDVRTFAHWILLQEQPENRSNDDNRLSPLLIFVYRYARVYLKKAMANTPLSSADDWGYLMGLLEKDGQTKIELIDNQIHEKTTGMEIIRRLIAGGWVKQVDSTQDKRSKQLYITESGRVIALEILGEMTKVAGIVRGNLTEQEQAQLIFILQKLELFHNPIFRQHRDKSNDDVLSIIGSH